MKTAITKLLDIEVPILLGGMQWVSRGELVAAAANAGGTGFLPAATFSTKELLTAEIQKTRALTDKPFGVNISMLPDTGIDDQGWLLDVLAREKIPFVETSGRLVVPLIRALKDADIKIIHKVTSPRHALSACKAGVDAVVAVGYEGAGHPGMDQVGTFVNLPASAERVDIPVIAAGGICDGKSFAAALLLGADGVMMGTRFLATRECRIHDNFKRWILQADISDTVIIQRSICNAFRAVNNAKAQQVLGLEEMGCTLKELLPHISGKKGMEAMASGDMASAVLTAGQCAGRIRDIPTVKELFEKMQKEFDESLSYLNARRNQM